MSKTWDTKGKVLRLLSKQRMTLTDLSQQLGLAPSTLNQHIKELLAINAIRPVENPYVVKWKYYEANPEFGGMGAVRAAPQFFDSQIVKTLSIIAVLGVFVLFFFNSYANSASANGIVYSQQQLVPGPVASGVTAFSISDAPTASDITEVNLTLSRIYVHSRTTGKTYLVYNSPAGGGSFDLVRLRNVSKIVSDSRLPDGSYDRIIFNISNASVVVNGTRTVLFMPSSRIEVAGSFSVSGNTTNWVNVDVDLARSLHVTGSGRVIMLPVVTLRKENGAALSVGADGIVNVMAHGHIEAEEHFGSDAEGSMMEGSIPVSGSSGVQVRESARGNLHARIAVNASSGGGTSIAIAKGDELIIITAPAREGDTQGAVSNATIVVDNPSAKGEDRIRCSSGSGTISCDSVGSIDAHALGRIISSNVSVVVGNLHGGKGQDATGSAEPGAAHAVTAGIGATADQHVNEAQNDSAAATPTTGRGSPSAASPSDATLPSPASTAGAAGVKVGVS